MSELGLNPHLLLQRLYSEDSIEQCSNWSVELKNDGCMSQEGIRSHAKFSYSGEPSNPNVHLSWQTPLTLDNRQRLKHYLQVAFAYSIMFTFHLCFVLLRFAQFFFCVRRLRVTLRHVYHYLLQTLFSVGFIRDPSDILKPIDVREVPLLVSVTDVFPAVCLLQDPLEEPCPLHLDWFQFPDTVRRNWWEETKSGQASPLLCSCKHCIRLVATRPDVQTERQRAFTPLLHWLCATLLPADTLNTQMQCVLEHLSLFSKTHPTDDPCKQYHGSPNSPNTSRTKLRLWNEEAPPSAPIDNPRTVSLGPENSASQEELQSTLKLGEVHVGRPYKRVTSNSGLLTSMPSLWEQLTHPRGRPLIYLETFEKHDAHTDWIHFDETRIAACISLLPFVEQLPSSVTFPTDENILLRKDAQSVLGHMLPSNGEVGSRLISSHCSVLLENTSGIQAVASTDSRNASTLTEEYNFKDCETGWRADWEAVDAKMPRCSQAVFKCRISVPPVCMFTKDVSDVSILQATLS